MNPPRQILLATLGVVVVYTALLAAMDFHLCLNDFWAWSFFAARMDFGDAGTFQNGFMPPAFAVFLKLLGPSREIAGAFVLTLLSVLVAACAIGKIVLRNSTTGAAALAIAALALFPPFLQSGLTAGPDIVVASLVAIAVAIYWSEGCGLRGGLLAGAVLGLAVLVRSHALFAALGILVASALVDRKISRAAGGLVFGLLVGVMVQILVNLAAGEAAWSNTQAFNVHKMVYGMDWYAPVTPESSSIQSIIADEPALFFRQWAGALLRSGVWLLGPAVALIFGWHSRQTALLRLSGASLIAGALYTIPVSLGDSPRATVVISALIIPPVAILILELRRRRVAVPALAIAAVIAVGVVMGLRSDRQFLIHNFNQHNDFQILESRLASLGVNNAREVFTDDFDLYFRSIEGQRPLTKGGWGLIGIEGWAEQFPQLPTDDAAGFLESCRANGVRYLALTRKSRRLGSQFAILRYDPAAAGAQLVGEYGEFLLVAVPELP